MSGPSDRDLIETALRGEAGAFATLISRYRDVYTRFAMRVLGGYDAADDALQTTFIRAYQSLNRCREREQFGDWLFRLIINECRARALRRVVRERATGEVAVVGATPRPLAPDAAAMQRVLDQIDPADREPFILLYIEELPYTKIAMLTGAPVQALERQVDRACARLRELMPPATNETRLSSAGLELLANEPEPSLAVQLATPLRRPEVLNDNFEDRLMAKLLRAGGPDGSTNGDSLARGTPVAASTPTLPPSPWTAHNDSPAPPSRRVFLVVAGIAGCLAIAAFITGYAARRWRDVRDVERRRPSRPVVVNRVVKRTDTLRVMHADTVVLARFAFVDAAAKSVSLVGDFNDWNAVATPLERGMSKGLWSTTLSMPPGRYEYAFLVDGKRWTPDPFARATHDESGVRSSVAIFGSGEPPFADGSVAARSRLKKLLPRDVSDRLLARVASAREQGLPAGTLEQHALELAARHIAPKEIEHIVVAEADRLARARRLLAASAHTSPSASELISGADVLRSGGDSAVVLELARAVPSRRSVAVPLSVVAELVGGGMNAPEAMDKVRTRVHNDASDAALERWGDETAVRLASRPPEKGKATRVVAKRGGTTEIRQAGSPKPSEGKKKKTSGTPHKP